MRELKIVFGFLLIIGGITLGGATVMFALFCGNSVGCWVMILLLVICCFAFLKAGKMLMSGEL